MELTYRKVGDYFIPNLEVPESPKIGKYASQREVKQALGGSRPASR